MDIRELIPKRVAVKTSVGVLYVRHQWSTDAKDLEGLDGDELAKKITRLYASDQEDPLDERCLPEAIEAKLNKKDIKKLLLTVAKNLKLKEALGDVSTGDLGELIKRSLMKERQKQKEAYEKLHRDYAFMGVDKISELYKGVARAEEAFRSVTAPYAQSESFNELVARLGSNDPWSKLERGEAVEISAPIAALRRPEDSVLGKAALQTALSSQEASQATQALAVMVGELNQRMVNDIFPAWFEQVAKQQGDSLAAAEKAQKSLKWTRSAVYVSVAATVVSILVTAGVAYWQTQVSRDLDSGSTAAQAEIQALLQKQLAGQERLIEIQVNEIERLKKREIESASLDKEGYKAGSL